MKAFSSSAVFSCIVTVKGCMAVARSFPVPEMVRSAKAVIPEFSCEGQKFACIAVFRPDIRVCPQAAFWAA